MSEEHSEEQDTERPERAVLVRRFETELAAGDGRTVDMRIVPFGERATVTDGFGGVARGVPYQEEWMPGVFDRQLRAANRVLLNFEHQQGIAGVVGHGLQLERRGDGYHGSFRVHDSSDGDKALMLVKEGVLTGASVEAFALKGGSVRAADGTVQRTRAHLDSVALCRKGAFAGAVVTAIRSEDLDTSPATDLLSTPIDPELVARCRHLGIKLPQRYEAHPDATDTPAETGTSESGTGQDIGNHSQEESK
jgi:uncharacterized protein